MIRLLALIAYPLGMALGQLMFKLAAVELRGFESASLSSLAVALALNPWFIMAVLLYAALSVTWVWILSGMPLSAAYPFVAPSFLLTPLFGHYLFGEALSWNYAGGLALVIAGLLLVLR